MTDDLMSPVMLDRPLSWREVAAHAQGDAPLQLSANARARIDGANAIVRSVVERGIRAYGVNTGVGALSEVIIGREQQSALSRNIVMSHAVGSGPALPRVETRAIMIASVNLYALGFSGLRASVVETLIALLNADCTPRVPRQGSVGYLSHRAHIGLALLGYGDVLLRGRPMPAARALGELGLTGMTLEAKEGLCLVNGTACVGGLGSVALERASRIMDWADVVAAMTFETQRCQLRAIDPEVMALHASPGLNAVATRLHDLLRGSAILAQAAGRRTQDALSLRAIPQVHGAVRDAWAGAATVVDRELASCTDNPIVSGSVSAPCIRSQAHPVGAGIGLAMDHLGVAMAQLGMISERRLDRMVNPLVSGMPAFLAAAGTGSGFMIGQYAAVSLVAENRRLAAPAALDGGVTSALQEDLLCHATPAALKALDIIENVRRIVALELLAACRSYELLAGDARPAAATAAIYRALRERVAAYADDRPLSDDMDAASLFLASRAPDDILHAAKPS